MSKSGNFFSNNDDYNEDEAVEVVRTYDGSEMITNSQQRRRRSDEGGSHNMSNKAESIRMSSVEPSARSQKSLGLFITRVQDPVTFKVPNESRDDEEEKRQLEVTKKKKGSAVASESPFTILQGMRRMGKSLQGRKVIRLVVLPIDGNEKTRKYAAYGIVPAKLTDNRTKALGPTRLLDLESGRSVLLTFQRHLNPIRYQGIREDAAVVATAMVFPTAFENFVQNKEKGLQEMIQAGDAFDITSINEIGFVGGAWRGFLRRLMVLSYDEITGLLLSRQLQLFIPFQTGYEAYLTSLVIDALDRGMKPEIDFILKLAFNNRNVSRVIVQNVGPRWDFFWHLCTQITWNRLFDAWGLLPIVGITSFAPTENFPTTRDHALASMFRYFLGPGNWLTRVFTQGREGIVTDNPKTTAQNLAAESNGFELANRNQYGTYFGRRKTNAFRFAHRLPTDESLVRTFIAQPVSTMTNNGVVHMLRQLANHWHNMLNQFSGNFAHQRMEQLDPFETMRFSMPVVMVLLSNYRGRNRWDSEVLGPFIRKCQSLKAGLTADPCRELVAEMQETIVLNLCAGVASVVDPLRRWLDAIKLACDGVEADAKEVYRMLTTVELGIRLGHDLITQVDWSLPSDTVLMNAILQHIRGKKCGPEVSERRIRSAMLLTTPRDKRTLIELVKCNAHKSLPAQLLLGRVKTLLQRDLRREALNEAIRELAKGDKLTNPMKDEWYWLEEGEKRAVYVYDGKVAGRDLHRFFHVDSGFERTVPLLTGEATVKAYIPVAEAISRAQKCFMDIELYHGKKYHYNAFMSFSFLRTPLRKLMVIAQVYCEELDNARVNILREIQRSNHVQLAISELEMGKTYYTYNAKTDVYEPFKCEKEYKPSDPEWSNLSRSKIVKIPPQSITVIGGGPTGLMTTIHCTESCLISGGVMKLFEARDAFVKGGATFERAQIVRLDARWIAMLRYHLGTGFEDVYIPASGETDSQLGNTLPTQGFVEITIKDLENMLHVEVSRLWSKGVIQCFTEARAQYDLASNAVVKQGDALKVEDLILRRVDPNGKPTNKQYTWKVVKLIYTEALGLDDLHVGQEYGVYIRLEDAVIPFKLTGVNLESRTYTFKSLKAGIENLKATAHSLPSVYPKGTRRHADVSKVVVECVRKRASGDRMKEELAMKKIKKEKFTMDIGHTHVIECIGKPHGSEVHFSVTTYEPYGVCCIQGLKISMLMHNFGEKRWGQGFVDDLRSHNDQNTRIVGDFTKMVRQAPIATLMHEFITSENWQLHFEKVVEESDFPKLNSMDPIVPKLEAAMKILADSAPSFRRQTLQTRFFETGDNYYLGMEFNREYDRWKKKTVDELVAPVITGNNVAEEMKKKIEKLKGLLNHHIDRLWYEATLETIRQGDVYNPGARRRVPRLYLINSYIETKLGKLPVGESFRLCERPDEKYEVMIKTRKIIYVRNVEGYITKMKKATLVKREGNLTRGPDGNAESRVALATFPVGHYVNHRTLRLNNMTNGYVFAFIGDEQATPHFMRYSGLTGACINAMLFNSFVKQALNGDTFVDRFALYSNETNWSNGEVVQRGTNGNYGEDGFLRPGFPYDHGLDYLHSKVIEYMESQQDLDNILTFDWKKKFAASMIPRGMEMNKDFITSLRKQTQKLIFDKFMTVLRADTDICNDELEEAMMARREAMDSKREELDHFQYWKRFLKGMKGLDKDTKFRLKHFHMEIASRLEQIIEQIIDFGSEAYLYNIRITSELFNQPKPVDSIVDDFAVEAQNFANSLTLSAALSSGALAFTLMDIRGDGSPQGQIWAALGGALNILLSFGTMANVSRYKIRNEEARVLFFEEKFLSVKKAVFSMMHRNEQDATPDMDNPFITDLENRMEAFVKSADYYDIDEQTELKEAYATLKANINDPEAIRNFQHKLASYFIADVYHVNSYLQEELVKLYKVADDMHRLLTQPVEKSTSRQGAKQLLARLHRFTPMLDNSLQRGPVRFGFLKKRRFLHWDCSVAIRYFYSLICCSRRRGRTPFAPIQTETLGIVKQATELSKQHGNTCLRREIRDLEQLYWATRESDIASLLFLSGYFVFISSIVFTIGRIIRRAGGPDTVTNVAYWATAASATAAVLAAFHFVRKLYLLLGLWCTLGYRARQAPNPDAQNNIRKARGVTFTQILLTLVRLFSASASGVALSWAVAQNGFDDKIDTEESLPFWIALVALLSAIGATIFFFIVEYIVRYNLSPRLGEYVCEAFRDEIDEMYKILQVPLNSIDTKQVQERETWEYVAREFLHKYRFDTVFAADRFGAILQYLQSGMDRKT